MSGERVDATKGALPGSSRPKVAAVDDLAGQLAPNSSPDLYYAIISVDRREDMKTPDSIIHDGSSWRTAEIKTLDAPTGSALQRNLRAARHQSRTVVIDGFGIGLSPDDARVGIGESVRNFGPDFDQIVIRVADGTALLWAA